MKTNLVELLFRFLPCIIKKTIRENEMRDTSRELAAIAAITNRLVGQLRQVCLEQIVATTISLVREMGFHISDFLNALARYVQTSSSVSADTEVTRTTVASLLEAAALEAEAEGRELP